MTAREAAPAEGEGREDLPGRRSSASLAPTADVPLLHELPARARAIVLAYFEAGVIEGIERGRAQVEAEDAASWAALKAEVMPRLRAWRAYADLADARGESARAEAQRRILADRGIWPVAS